MTRILGTNIAYTDLSQSYSSSQSSSSEAGDFTSLETPTASGNYIVTLDGRKSNCFVINVPGTITNLTMINIRPFTTYLIDVIQGSIGRPVSLDSQVFKRLEGDTSAISFVANKVSILTAKSRNSSSQLTLFPISVEV
jgi:hypothetical protein